MKIVKPKIGDRVESTYVFVKTQNTSKYSV